VIELNLAAARACFEDAFDPSAALQQLRWGQFANGDRQALPVDQAWLRNATWYSLRRMPPPSDEASAALESAFAVICATGERLAFLLSAGSGWSGLSIGVARDSNSAGILAALLAPGILLGLANEPEGLATMLDESYGRQAVVLRPTATSAAEGDPELRPAHREGILSLLERVMALASGPDVAVVLVADGVAAAELEGLRLGIEEFRDSLGRQVSSTHQVSDTASVTEEDPAAKRLSASLGALGECIEEARSTGGWGVAIEVVGSSVAALTAAAASTASALATVENSGHRSVTNVVDVAPGGISGRSLLTSSDLAWLFRPPSGGSGGLEVLTPPPTSRVRRELSEPLLIGSSVTGDPFALDLGDFRTHAFITGLTGSGKSTTIWRILTELRGQRPDLPFLIIDPVKSEHEALASLIDGGMQVLRARDLRMSALEPLAGFDRLTHLGLVATAFRGCFALPSPVPYVLRLLFDRLVDLNLGPASFHDLQSSLPEVVADLGYRGDVEANIQAALGTRLAVLTEPRRAGQLCAASNEQIESLLSRPTLVELSDCGDDEERNFLMALLTIYVSEAARLRGSSERIEHVLVLEEAHRILPEPNQQRSGGEVEGGDAASVVSRQITQLLAEVRSSGEAIIVADQSPAALAREVIRNTGLKIAHRVVDPDDRALVGGAMGLNSEEGEVLATLAPGEAVVAAQRVRRAQTIQVIPVQGESIGSVISLDAEEAWPCCGGGEGHHRAEHRAPELALELSLQVLATSQGNLGSALSWTKKSSAPHGLPPRCAALVALRSYLRRLLTWGQIEEALAKQVMVDHLDHVAEGKLTDLVQTLLPTLSSTGAPWESCADCVIPCLALGVDGAALALETQAILHHLSQVDLSSRRDVLAKWGRGIELGYVSTVGTKAAAGLAHCARTRISARVMILTAETGEH